jgi:putative copper export protein
MFPVELDTVRLFLHVLAATVWVGGQITIAGVVPVLRRISPEAPRIVARRFGAIAWGAFAVLIVTGIWNVAAVPGSTHGAAGRTLLVKLIVVAISGISAWAHSVSHSRRGIAVWGALAALSALGALFLGVLLSG